MSIDVLFRVSCYLLDAIYVALVFLETGPSFAVEGRGSCLVLTFRSGAAQQCDQDQTCLHFRDEDTVKLAQTGHIASQRELDAARACNKVARLAVLKKKESTDFSRIFPHVQ